MRSPFGPAGLFVFAAIAALALTLAMLVWRRARDPAPDAEAEPWKIAAPLSMAGGELDPRNPEWEDGSNTGPHIPQNGESHTS